MALDFSRMQAVVRKGIVSVVNLTEVWSKLFETGHAEQQRARLSAG